MIPRAATKLQRSNALAGQVYDRELSPLALEKGVVVNQDRSLACGFRLDAPYTPTLADEAIRGNCEALAGFMNALPAHFDIQAIWTQHSRCAELESRLAGMDFSQGLVGEVQRERQECILDGLRGGRLRWMECYLILARKLPWNDREIRRRTRSKGRFRPGLVERAAEFFTDARGRFQYDVQDFSEATAELLTHARSLAATLDGLGWSPAPLDNDAVTLLFFQRWNPRQFECGSNPRRFKPGSGVPFSEHFAHTDFRWDPRGIEVPAGIAELDGWHHAVLTLLEPPEEMGRPVFDALVLSGGLARAELVVNAERGDRLHRMKRLKTLLQQRQSDPGTSNDPAERSASAQITQELEEMGSNSEGTWRAACYLHLWASEPAELRERVASALSLARSLDMVFIQERRALWPYWRAMQPFWTQDKDRFRLLDYSTRQLVRLLPLFGQPANLPEDKAVGVLFETASRGVFNWIVPDESLFSNPHRLIVGGTGSGKSALEDEILIGMRRKGAKVVIIDLGGSFANFCESSAGVYIDYNIKSRTNRMNPLWLPPGTPPDPEFLRSRALWLESLVSERGERLSSDELVVLEGALRRAYFRDLQEPVFLRHVRAILARDERGAAAAHRLSPWCEDGSFANLFDGPSQVDLSAPVVVFDLKRILGDQRDPGLARAIFNSIVGAVAGLSLDGGREPRFLTFDEAGVMLKDEATAEFMEYCFRTLRKAGVSVCAISQGLEDFMAQGRARSAFVGAADNLFVLKQDNADKARLIAQEKNLSARELAHIQSVNTAAGSHAEFLLIQKTPHGQRTLHLLSRSSPLKYAFTCNSPEDRREIQAHIRGGMTRPEAIRKFAREHPAGILSSRLAAAVAIAIMACVIALGAAGCAHAARNTVQATGPEEAEEARRAERIKIMQEYWTQQTAPAARTPGAPEPLFDYPAGSYGGVNFGPRAAADPGLSEPSR